MSILTSLFTGVSGLNANSAALSVVGDNIANMNTVGFKSSQVSFADIVSSSMGGASSQVGLGVSVNGVSPDFTQGSFETTTNGLDLAISGNGFFTVKNQSGSQYYTRDGEFSIDKDGYMVNPNGLRVQGYSLDQSGNSTGVIGDINLASSSSAPKITQNITESVNLQSSASIPAPLTAPASVAAPVPGGGNTSTGVLTSGGTFTGAADTAYTIKVTNAGDQTTATFQYSTDGGATWNGTDIPAGVNVPVGPDGVTVSFGAGNYSANDTFTVNATAAVNNINNANSASNYNAPLTVYDSLGNPHLVTIYFSKGADAPTGNTWEWNAVVGGSDTASGNTEVQAKGTLTFDSSGALESVTTSTSSFNFNGGAAQGQAITFNFGDAIAAGGTGYKGSTQFGSASATVSQGQDGYSSGALSGVSIDSTGTVVGSFTNGQTRSLAALTLANFADPQGLTKDGAGLYSASSTSGQPLVGEAGKSGMGSISANSLELSNVDLAAEFVKMIQYQRGFQANSKIITTTDQILNDVVNLKQ